MGRSGALDPCNFDVVDDLSGKIPLYSC